MNSKVILVALALLLFAGSVGAQTLVVQMFGAADVLVGLPGAEFADYQALKDYLGLSALDDGGFEPDACFTIPLIDPDTDVDIGEGIDCLKGIVDPDNPLPPSMPFPPELDKITTVEVVSFFVMPGGVLANKGLTTIAPFVLGVGDGASGPNPSPTHLTGSVPDDSAMSLLGGTGRFARRQGRGRVSGAVHVSGAGVFFDCLWKLVLEGRTRPGS